MEVCVKISFLAWGICILLIQIGNTATVRGDIKHADIIIKDILAKELKGGSKHKDVHSKRTVCKNCSAEFTTETSELSNTGYVINSKLSNESDVVQLDKSIQPEYNVQKMSDDHLTKPKTTCVNCVNESISEHSKPEEQANGRNSVQNSTYYKTVINSGNNNDSRFLINNTNTSFEDATYTNVTKSSNMTNFQQSVADMKDKTSFRTAVINHSIDFNTSEVNQTTRQDIIDSEFPKSYSVIDTPEDEPKSNKSEIDEYTESLIRSSGNETIIRQNSTEVIEKINSVLENVTSPYSTLVNVSDKNELSSKNESLTNKDGTNSSDAYGLEGAKDVTNTTGSAKRPSGSMDVIYKETYDSGQFNNTSVVPTENSTESVDQCKACAMREGRKKLRLEQIKRQILSQLRFTTVPNVTARKLPDVSPIMHLLNSEIQSDSMESLYSDDDDALKVERIITFGKPLLAEEHKNLSGGCYFVMSEDIMSSHVRQAVLWVFLDPSLHSLTSREYVLINVYAIGGKSKDGKGDMEWVHYLKLPSRKAIGWIDFDLSKIVHRWIKHPYTNRGLKLEAINSEGRNIVTTPRTNDDDDSKEEHVPFLDMKMSRHRPHRKRRSLNICTDTSFTHRCCRYPLEVNFVQLGWNFVMAPTSYQANFCAGECGIDSGLNRYPFSTVVQRTGISPCCAPTKMGSMPMLYVDHHREQVKFAVLPNMSVKRCGCS